MPLPEKWSYLRVLSRKSLSDDRRLGLTFMDYARQTEEIFGTVDLGPGGGPPPVPEPGVRCLSCGADLNVRSLYCDEFCKGVAKFVRYVRGCQADGRVRKPDIQEAIGVRILMLNGGGYPERERDLPAALRKSIFLRDEGKCQVCGDVATQIDHIKGSSDAPFNLRAACGPCNRRLAFEAAGIADSEQQAFIEELWDDLAERVAASAPIRVCDDPDEWKHKWRSLKAEASRKGGEGMVVQPDA
jgi:hypothetical protein